MITLKEFLDKADGRAAVFQDLQVSAKAELTDTLTVVIPDIHLLEQDQNDDFLDSSRAQASLGSLTAFEDRFIRFLEFLLSLKDQGGEGIAVINIGDLYDLWQARGNTNEIESRYTNVLGFVSKLDPVYIIGNHDIDLWRHYRQEKELPFRRRWRSFGRDAQGDSTVLFEHGYQADFANNVESWTGVFGEVVAKLVDVMEFIDPDIDVELGGMWDSITRVFSGYNGALTPRKNPSFNTHEFTNYYVNLLRKYRLGDTTDHRECPKLTCAVIGHTHRARLVTRTIEGVTYILMDTGSWVNGGHEYGVIAGRDLAVCTWE